MSTKEEGLQNVRGEQYTNIRSVFRLLTSFPSLSAGGGVRWSGVGWGGGDSSCWCDYNKEHASDVAQPYFFPRTPSQSEKSMPVKS